MFSALALVGLPRPFTTPETAAPATPPVHSAPCANHADQADHAGRADLVCLDRSAGGTTVRVARGSLVQVDLGGGLVWRNLHQVGAGARLLRSVVPATTHDGVLTARYRAEKSGRTALEATGAPHCAPGRACPQFLLLWRVQVIVRAP
jgi:hypothetical protein